MQTILNLRRLLVILIALPALYLDMLVYQSGQFGLAMVFLFIICLFVYIYLSEKAYTYRYLFPGLLGFAVFVIFPLLYTFVIGFTKYESQNLLSHERVRADFLSQTYKAEDARKYAYDLYRQSGDEYRLHLKPNEAGQALWSDAFVLMPPDAELALPAMPIRLSEAPAELTGSKLALRDITKPKLFVSLKDYGFAQPGGSELTIDGLRSFAAQSPLWVEVEGQSLRNERDGRVIWPDMEQGYYVDQNGEKAGFGFRVWSGLDNYQTIFGDERVKQPFVKIFIWTFIFAGVSVAASFAVGMTLAVLLEWEGLKGRKIYRTLLILPYAVPAFLSILVFKGMFNQEAGAINEFLNGLFGMKPEWTTNPQLAKMMVLLVNLWLGYPYMMLISTGVLQSIPKQIYEASSIDGSNTVHDFFKLTLPLILPPILPLLIASFAFNFNNFNLIFLLTQGGPKMVNSTGVAGNTDILVTYTFNLAFLDSGNNYGLACAIATILFFIVGTFAWINLKLSGQDKGQIR